MIRKPYPKDNEPRTIGIRPEWVEALSKHIKARSLGRDDLLFPTDASTPISRNTFRRRIWSPTPCQFIMEVSVSSFVEPAGQPLLSLYSTRLGEAFADLLPIGPRSRAPRRPSPSLPVRDRQNGHMRITVLSGGVGGSRFVQGLLAVKQPDDEVTVIGNTADDIWLLGLRVCPDLDTVMYTLGNGIDSERRWGRTDETWNAKDELTAYGVEETWFGLGDRDLATHILRTQLLNAGGGLAAVTSRLCERWNPGVRLLPMTEHEVETHIAIDGEQGREVIHFQEYWIRLRANVPVREVIVKGAEQAIPGPGVVDAIQSADVVILPPSNPIVSVGTILSIKGIREAVAATKAPVVGVSPIINGGAVRGMADQLLTGLGVEISAAGIAERYGNRADGGVIDGWLIDSSDVAELDRIRTTGIQAQAVPLFMNDEETTNQLARDTLEFGRSLTQS